MRQYTSLDHLLINLDTAVRTVFDRPVTTDRPRPDADIADSELTDSEKRHATGLMRINHTGEVCAQALYQGQALTARLDEVRSSMEQAAMEENDHLAWCKHRLTELDSHTSRLNPLWYAGSFVIGASAGLAGDKWSLGFVAETENQVVRHLQNHLEELPENDHRSRAILEQMKRDEAHHATTALEAGAAALPGPVKQLMKLASRIMTRTAYWI